MSPPAARADAAGLPAQPLVAAIERRGGVGRLLTGRRGPHGGRLARAYARARVSGRVTVVAGDELACRLLRAHPAAVWGGSLWHPSRDQGSDAQRPRDVAGAEHDNEEGDLMAKRLDPPASPGVSPLAQQAGHAMRAAWSAACEDLRQRGDVPLVDAHDIPWPQLGQAAVDAVAGRVRVEQRRSDTDRNERLLGEVTRLLRGLRDATVAPRPRASLAYTEADEYLRALDEAAPAKEPAA